MTKYDKAGLNGLKDEIRITAWLQASYPWCDVMAASPAQNCFDDIDVFWCNKSYSIKSCPSVYNPYRNVPLEDRIQWRKTKLWAKSWLWTTRADYFMFLLGNKQLIVTPVTSLQAYVRHNPKTLAKRTAAVAAANSEHGHSDNRLYLMPVRDLINLSYILEDNFHETLHPFRSSCLHCVGHSDHQPG